MGNRWVGLAAALAAVCCTGAPGLAQEAPAETDAAAKLRVGAFERTMRNPDPDAQIRAIYLLAAQPHPRLVKALAPWMHHPHDPLMDAAVRAMGFVGWRLEARERGVVVELLARAVAQHADRRYAAARAAIEALATLGDRRGVAKLLAFIDHDGTAPRAVARTEAVGPPISHLAIAALAELQDLSAVEPLIAELRRLAPSQKKAGPNSREPAESPWRKAARERSDAIRAALRSLTGEQLTTPQEWSQWWDATGKERLAVQRREHRGAPGRATFPPTLPPAPTVLPPVARAVRRGCDWLLERVQVAQLAPGLGGGLLSAHTAGELELLALAHAGYARHPKVRAAVTAIATQPFDGRRGQTYNFSLQIMLLERVDGERWQERIAQLAWWLVHAQDQGGGWGYLGPDLRLIPRQFTPSRGSTLTRFPGVKLTGPNRPRDDDASPTPDTFEIRRKGWFDAPWIDLSNTQFAALGLHAAERAHVRCPESTWRRLEQRYVSDRKTGGWGYTSTTMSSASMTAGALSSLAVVREVLDNASPDRDGAVAFGFRELGRMGLAGPRAFGVPRPRHLASQAMDVGYWLWSLERACVLWNRSEVGGRDWYAALTPSILEAQRADGSWGPRGGAGIRGFSVETHNSTLTAFTVLFLAKAAPAQREDPDEISRADLDKPDIPEDDRPAPRDDGSDGIEASE